MKKIVILGAGTAGTLMSAKLRRELDPNGWEITLVDQDNAHLYQPGLLFIPFGVYKKRDVVRPRSRFVPAGVQMILSEIDLVEPDDNRVRLSNGVTLDYDFLVIATGSRIVPSELEGLTGPGWRKNTFDFYTLDGAVALADALEHFEGGRLVVNFVELPIKCPVAPLEFTFLADWYLTQRGLRHKTELVYATPLDGAFTRPRASAALGHLLEAKNVQVLTDFNSSEVDGERGVLSSWDGAAVDFDLLVSVPTNMGSEVIERSDMGDELAFIPTDRGSLQSEGWNNVFVIGDATDLPTSKAGSVAHFQGEVLLENLLRAIHGRPLDPCFDGHANCFIETGFGKALLIDFNYETEPLPGRFPLPGVGPMTLLGESEMNHWGKLAFKWIYWNVLLKGEDLPGVPHRMTMSGKWS
jgi:sulfide:quinone oxidoreductase